MKAGYSTYVQGTIKLSAGYTFNIPFKEHIRLAIFTEGVFTGPYPQIAGEWNILMPKFQFNFFRNFQLSIGLGIGLSGGELDLSQTSYDYLWFKANSENCGWESCDYVGFLFTPVFEFAWYVTPDWFVGFAIDVPMIAFDIIFYGRVDLTFSFGYKF